MADISKLSRLINGVSRNVDISTNTLVVDNLKLKLGSANFVTFSGTLTGNRTVTVPDADVDLGQIATNTAAIAAEVTNRTNADTALQSAIDAEESARIADVEGLQSAIDSEESARIAADALLIPLSQKGAANGVATLDSNGLVPAAQLPSYVDDVLEFADLASFPAEGEAGKIYVALDDNKTYRWSGSTYIYITSGAVDSVNGQTGVVVLDTGDILLDDGVTILSDELQALQDQITSEVNTREADVSALNDTIAEVRNTALTSVVYVSKGGNDSTGTGSISNPFLTAKAAMASITDNSASKVYDIKLAPGTYVEADDFAFKPFVNIVGEDNQMGTVLMHSTATTAIELQASGFFSFGIFNIELSSPVKVKQNTVGQGGFFEIHNCVVDTDVIIDNLNNSSVLSFSCLNSRIFNKIDSIGPVSGSIKGCFLGNLVTFGSPTTSVGQSGFTFDSCYANVNAQVKAYGASLSLFKSFFDVIIVDTRSVASRRFTYDAVSMPRAGATITGTPIITVLTGAKGIAYDGSTASDWNSSTLPTNLSTAVDQLGSRVKVNETNISAAQAAIAQEAIDRAADVDAEEAARIAADALLIPLTEKGAANGVATLNADGKLSASQVPSIAITSTFVVADETEMLSISTAEEGDVAVRTDLNKSFILTAGDRTLAASWQELLSPTDQVQSVNGQTGTVVLDTDDVNEGSTNKYFTEARTLATLLAGLSTSTGTAITASDSVLSAFGKLQAQVSNITSDATRKVMVAGESLAANSSFLMRMAVDGETAGRVYKADIDAGAVGSENNHFYVIGMVTTTGAVSAGGNISVTLVGEMAIGSGMTPFASSDIGKPVFLGASGALTVTAPSGTNIAVVRVGTVMTTTSVLVQGIQLLGIDG